MAGDKSKKKDLKAKKIESKKVDTKKISKKVDKKKENKLKKTSVVKTTKGSQKPKEISKSQSKVSPKAKSPQKVEKKILKIKENDKKSVLKAKAKESASKNKSQNKHHTESKKANKISKKDDSKSTKKLLEKNKKDQKVTKVQIKSEDKKHGKKEKIKDVKFDKATEKNLKTDKKESKKKSQDEMDDIFEFEINEADNTNYNWDIELKAPAELLPTNEDGLPYCRVRDCDQVASVDGYCRFHYILHWKRIQNRRKIIADGKLERYIEELTARYPDRYLEILYKDLRTEKDFISAIQELEIDDGGEEGDFDDDQTLIDEVRGMSDAATPEEDEF